MSDPVVDHRLTLPEVLKMLVADGLVPAAEAEVLARERRLHRGDVHPLVVIADQKWKSVQPPHRILHLEALAEWLAGRVGLEYLHIDPLKIDFSTVTEVMSNAYAGRFKILPVQVTSKEVVIATAEPYLREWEKELTPILRKDIRRVLANPADIARYLVEFYNLARSVKKAAQSGESGSGIASFEQLVEMGKSNRQFDANDQHIVHIVDWLWQY
ncbi:MAG: type II/IV secretion system protein, partial [Betaproteobacteria bacterium]|nr:type II/IV secretion system protein [Betaproteobacteria bacterium]